MGLDKPRNVNQALSVQIQHQPQFCLWDIHSLSLSSIKSETTQN